MRDGCLLDVQVDWNRKRADDGRLTGFVSVITDITARRRAEAERTRLVTAIDELVEAVVITDPDGTIEDVNPAFERMTGYPPSEAIGQNMRILKSGKHDRAFYKELWDTIKRGQVWTGTFINKKKDGTLYEEEESISPVRDEHGKITNFVAVKYDVTERKLAAEQIRKHQDELAHLSRLSTMGEMATELAHELNQPLASIVNYTSGCVKRIKAGRPDLQELVAVLNDASSEAQRAGEIIKRIRRFVQKREPARTNIDIAELIRQVLDLMRHDLQQQGIQMRLEVEEHMPTLQGDRIQLQQVLINLLRNSIEAMNETEMKHRRLTVGATTDNHDCMTIFVHDTGCGLGEVDPDSVFEAFYTTREDGTGMGLAISRTIIEAHGGHLEVTNNADGGCTFHFSLPRRWEA